MLDHALGHGEVFDFLCRDLLCVSAHDQMDFVRCRVDLIEQTLEVDRAAGASRGDDEFHYTIQNHRTRSHSRSDWQSTRSSHHRDLPAEELPHLFGNHRDGHRAAQRQPVVVRRRSRRFRLSSRPLVARNAQIMPEVPS